MYPTGLVDYGLIIDVKTIKDIMRFVKFFSEKYSRKVVLYRVGGTILFSFRRQLDIGMLGITLRSRAPRLVKGDRIFYNHYKDMIVIKPKSYRASVWGVDVINICNLNLVDLVEISEKFVSNRNRLPFWIEIVDVLDEEDIIDYAYYAKDVLLYTNVGGEKFLMSGLLTSIFTRFDPCLYLLRTRINREIENPRFIDLTEGIKYVERLSFKTLRYVYVINVERMHYYGGQSKRAGNDSVAAE